VLRIRAVIAWSGMTMVHMTRHIQLRCSCLPCSACHVTNHKRATRQRYDRKRIKTLTPAELSWQATQQSCGVCTRGRPGARRPFTSRTKTCTKDMSTLDTNKAEYCGACGMQHLRSSREAAAVRRHTASGVRGRLRNGCFPSDTCGNSPAECSLGYHSLQPAQHVCFLHDALLLAMQSTSTDDGGLAQLHRCVFVQPTFSNGSLNGALVWH